MEEVCDDVDRVYLGRLLQRVRANADMELVRRATAARHGGKLLADVWAEYVVEPDNPAHERRWNALFIILNACVPEHKMEDLKVEVGSETESIWPDVGWMIFNRVVSRSLTLGLGFVVHLLV